MPGMGFPGGAAGRRGWWGRGAWAMIEAEGLVRTYHLGEHHQRWTG